MFTMSLLLSADNGIPFALTLQPEARAAAVLASLRQIASLPGAGDVPACALVSAFKVLGRPGLPGAEDAATVARRATVGQVGADIWGYLDSLSHQTEGDVSAAPPWFQAQVDSWSEASDLRQRAMAVTAARELAELVKA